MPKLTRYTVKQFGASGPSTDFGQFGSKTAAAPQTSQNPSIIMQLAAWATGWTAAAVGAAFNPYLEDMNGFCLVVMYFLANLFERGIPDWDTGTTYYQGALVNNPAVPGDVYVSLTDNNLANAIPGHAGNAQWKWWNPSGSGSGLDADTVDGSHAATTPVADKLLALNGDAKFPSSVFPGTVVQSLRTADATFRTLTNVIPFDNTKPGSSEGYLLLTRAITPSNANNKLRVRGLVPMSSSDESTKIIALFKDAEVEARDVGVAWANGSVGTMWMVPVDYEMVAGSTDPISFTLRVGVNVGTFYVNGYGTQLFDGCLQASLTVDEIAV